MLFICAFLIAYHVKRFFIKHKVKAKRSFIKIEFSVLFNHKYHIFNCRFKSNYSPMRES